LEDTVNIDWESLNITVLAISAISPIVIFIAIKLIIAFWKKRKRNELERKRNELVSGFKEDVERLDKEKDLHRTDVAQYLMRELANNGVLPEEVGTTLEKLREYEELGFNEMADYYIDLAKHEGKNLQTVEDYYNEYLKGTPGAITMADNVEQVMIRLRNKLVEKEVG